MSTKKEGKIMSQINLGDKVRDRVTGFEGIAVFHARHLYGCDTIGIKTEKLHDGKPINAQSFDILSVEKIEEKITEVTPPGEGVG